MLYNLLIDHIQNNQDKFYRIAYSYVKNREDALDIVQEAVLKALKSYKKVKEPNYFTTWFYRILTNTAISYIRKSKKIIPMSDHMIEAFASDTSHLDLYDALDLLKPDDRTLIILRYFEDMKFKDISAITGLNISTVKTRHTRILEQLKNALDWEENTYE